MKETDEMFREQDAELNSAGMKRRDFLKRIGLFSATFLVSGLSLPRDAVSPAKTTESKQDAPYYVSGWCIPH
jgi:hypothetical protein